MRTLEEVIAELEDEGVFPDALHYLKTIETTENLYHDAINELSKLKDEDWKDRCLPLSWDELHKMVGKPIWIESENGNRWGIIESFAFYLPDGSQEYMQTEDGEGFADSTHERGDWRAYRKER